MAIDQAPSSPRKSPIVASGAIYKVRMSKVGGWATEKDLTGDQEQASAVIDNKPGSDYRDRAIGRLKTADGEVSAIIRNTQGQEHVVFASPSTPGEFRFPNGESYRLEVTTVKGPERPAAVDMANAPFKPPKFTIQRPMQGNQDGVMVTFAPTATPAVFTLAPEGRAKPLGLPSFPFPAQFPDGRARTQVSLFIPILAAEPPTRHGEGQAFLLASDKAVRIGVRGAGLFVRGIRIPAQGKSKVVEPEKFQFLEAQVDANRMNANVVAQKYAEKQGQLQYT